jgi:prepilin-type N-terminal cleavage/methylation domain-containing protein
MAPRPRKSHDGFTLIEVMISLGIFLVILLAVYQVFDSSHRTYASGTRKQDAQQNARLAMDEMIRGLRMAGYYPENFDAVAGNEIDASTVPRVQLGTNRTLATANTVTALAIFGDLDGSSSSNVFLYCWTNPGGGNAAPLYGKKRAPAAADAYACTGAGDVLADNVTDFSLTFYGLDATSNPVQIAAPLDGKAMPPYPLGGTPAAVLSFGAATIADRQAVRSVALRLQVREAVPEQTAQEYTLASTVRLRNSN